MQSDSDSEGEFFDAAESQNNSFDVGTRENTKDAKVQGRIITERQDDKNERNEKPHSPRKLKLSTSRQGENIVSGESKSLDSKDVNAPETGIDSSSNNYKDSSKKTEPQQVVKNVQKPRVRNLELDLKTNMNETELLGVNNDATSLPLLSPVSQLIKEVVSDTSIGSDVAESGSKKTEEVDAPAPVAPPRRKRKKKPEGKGLPETADKVEVDTKHKESTTPENPSSPVSTPESPKCQPFPSAPPLQPPEKEKTTTDIATDTTTVEDDDENDPVITLDYKSQEMKKVLEKASSTEVIHALTLDTRLKSHSVTSLGSSCNRSDSFASVSSVISNGPMMNNKSGSTASVSSTHSYQYAGGDKHGGLVRVRSASGRPLSDAEILEQVIVKNLDTGESIPLSLAEDRLPKGTNPLALHIMRLTSEFSSSNPKLNLIDQEDGVDASSKVKKKSKKLKRFIGRTVNKMKADKKTKEAHAQKGEDSSSSEDEDAPSTPYIKIKSAHGKGPEEFEKLKLLQDLSGEHVGAIWTVKFSVCGRLMATAGQDHMVRVWVLKENIEYFEEMRKKYSKSGGHSATPDPEVDQILEHDEEEGQGSGSGKENDEEEGNEEEDDKKKEAAEDDNGPFMKKPFCTYYGHTGDILDLSWSKNYFLLSSSMDKTVRLWHISRTECLCCFQHIDFVTAIVFHPRDDRYFLSGSLDGKIRLWNIPDKKVALWNEVEGTGSNLITAANFCLQGRFAVVGTYDGRCIFYETERLKYHTQWQVRSSSRNKRSRGRKISGIEPMPGEEKVLITSNDSRIRLYDLKDNSLSCKYKGCTNTSSQIKASFSHDGQYLICGSEDHFAYIWRTQHGIPSARRDKNEFYESFSAHDAVVTVATFAPVPWLIVPPDTSGIPVTSEVLVTADWSGAIKLFVNR